MRVCTSVRKSTGPTYKIAWPISSACSKPSIKPRSLAAFSEDKFTKVFRASPIAFSIATLGEGRILDVNEAFERRYGYTRAELIGRTVLEVGIWEDPQERGRMVGEIRAPGLIPNHATRLQQCILAVNHGRCSRPQTPGKLTERGLCGLPAIWHSWSANHGPG